jgi:signal transduction histidine kinase/ligand-binding sensor domain-containing protein
MCRNLAESLKKSALIGRAYFFLQLACLLLVGLFSSLVWSVPARDVSSEPVPATIKDYWHTAWRQRDGAPASIWAIAQTPDGWLWLATPSGLYRFDGVTFEPFDLLSPDDPSPRTVADFYINAKGDLWVLYSAGGVAVWHKDAAQGCCQVKGLPLGVPIDQFTELPTGQMLALVGDKFFLFDRDHWVSTESSVVGLDPQGLYSLQYQGDQLWAAASDGLYVWSKEWQKFVIHDKRSLIDTSLTVSGNGELWSYDAEHGYALVQRSLAREPQRGIQAWTSAPFLIDRQGSIWAVACGDAKLCRFRNNSHIPGPIPSKALKDDQFGAEDGFPAGGAMTAFEDRQGNLWFGTKLGLERFTPQAFSTVRFPEPLIYFAMARGPLGTLWVGTASAGFHDYWWSIEGQHATRWGTFAHSITAAYQDVDGTILAGSPRGLWRFDGKTFQPLEAPAAAKDIKLQAMVRDHQGRLWASYRGQPVYALTDGNWKSKGDLQMLPDQAPSILQVDRAGDVWFGYFTNQLAMLHDDKVSLFGAEQGLDLGSTTALITESPILVGGERGLAVFDGKVFRRIAAAQPQALMGITGLLRLKNGDLWLNGNAGAVRIGKSDLDRAVADSKFEVPLRIFNDEDGVAGGAQQVRPLPTLIQGTDGRLWFAGTNGLTWIDPALLRQRREPPVLFIRSIEAGDRTYAPLHRVTLPPQTHDLRITYSILNTISPTRQIFRYRLEGLKQRWQNVGSRQEAIYTNLGPGHYVFRLQGANEDGVWNLIDASVAFDIQPSFYETHWFLAIVVASLVLLAWLVYVARLHYIKRSIRERLVARHNERERIARDLHDTLLQAIQGLLLKLQVWALDPGLSAHRRREVDEFVDRARSMLMEGRYRILHLRREVDKEQGLEDLLDELIDEYSAETEAALLLHVVGGARNVAADILPDLADIAREALRNAVQHADANRIEVTLNCSDKYLTLVVQDDGCGIGEETLRIGHRPGHWGLRGMKERAERLSSTISIYACAEKGTEVKLTVPARIAYDDEH